MPFHILKYVFMAVYSLTVFTVILLSSKGVGHIETWIWAILYLVSLCLVFIPVREKKIGSYSRRAPVAVLIFLFTLMTSLLIIAGNLAPSEYFGSSRYGRFITSVLDHKAIFITLPVIWFLFLIPSLLLLLNKDPEKVYSVFIGPLLAGSALNVVSSMIFHHLVIKRGGCFAGIGSGVGVFCAFVIFLWVLGPAFLLYIIFLRKKRSRQ